MQLAGRTWTLAGMALPLAVAVLYLPSLKDLISSVWSTDEQAHGPIVLGVTAWLALRNWSRMLGNRSAPTAWGWVALIVGLAAHLLGRSQQILLFEVGSFIPFTVGLLLLTVGARGARQQWFALFFAAFMVPLPGGIVEALTMPMKMLVSIMAESLLGHLGYPVSRAGVVLHIGQYQLLVADACAGLHTLFTLEALGLLYLNVVTRASVARNITLAALIVPISFSANTIRVIALTLITYYLGDEAGQGFLHGFAGMVLFASALALIISVDSLLHLIFKVEQRSKTAAAVPT